MRPTPSSPYCLIFIESAVLVISAVVISCSAGLSGATELSSRTTKVQQPLDLLQGNNTLLTTCANNGPCTNKRVRNTYDPVLQKSTLNIRKPSRRKLSAKARKFPIRTAKRKCKVVKFKSFKCQRLNLYLWLLKNYASNVSLNENFAVIRNHEYRDIKRTGIIEKTWLEKFAKKFLRKWADPVDEFALEKFSDFIRSRELSFRIPKLLSISVTPRVHAVTPAGRSSTARWFWDPGFNLKLKLPFFKDELKVAISTGPSFIAGIGTGIVLLILKSVFGPVIFGMKYMLYNLFWKDTSPWEMMKMAVGGGYGPEPWESSPPPAIEHYEPPLVHNQYDNLREHRPPPFADGFGFGYDQNHQFSNVNPILQGVTGASGGSGPALDQSRRNHFKALLTGPDGGGFGLTGGSETHDNHIRHPEDNYIPSTALQAEVEHYDPFYSPLLSRIDAIFGHLGYHEEGCRERAVCSIYKFPVKYAPYSNLMSAQLSKHQSELKRPVTKSPKILRYFKYMKAAKDGQGQASCLEVYPNCDQDTDSVSNLPMITTFNQLSELMGSDLGSR